MIMFSLDTIGKRRLVRKECSPSYPSLSSSTASSFENFRDPLRTTNSHRLEEAGLLEAYRWRIKTISQWRKKVAVKTKSTGSRDYWIMDTALGPRLPGLSFSSRSCSSELEASLNSLPRRNVLATLPMTIMTIITVTTRTIIIRCDASTHRGFL